MSRNEGGELDGVDLPLIKLIRHLQHVERYKHRGAFQVLTETDVMTMNQELTPIVFMDERDEHAKRFDNLIMEKLLSAAFYFFV